MSSVQPLYLGFDIGASSVKWGYGNCKQGLLSFASVAILQRDLAGLTAIFHSVIDQMDKSVGLRDIHGIGIGTPGTIDLASGKIQGVNPNLPFWSDLSPAILIPTDINKPVFYDNDANLMCLGESTLWEAADHILGITVGSGIGSGFVSGKMVYRGAHGYALELGHITMVEGGMMCNCGRAGCLEAYSSVDGIKRRALSLGRYPDATGWNLQDILNNAQNDSDLQGFITEGERLLAMALQHATIILDPQLIILGGGGMDGGLYDAQIIDQLLQSALPRVNKGQTKVKKAKAGNRAGVLGALTLAERNLS